MDALPCKMIRVIWLARTIQGTCGSRSQSTLVTGDDKIGANAVHSDFILAIAEMCRLAERSVAENLISPLQTPAAERRNREASSI
jgi:hypothetical protein